MSPCFSKKKAPMEALLLSPSPGPPERAVLRVGSPLFNLIVLGLRCLAQGPDPLPRKGKGGRKGERGTRCPSAQPGGTEVVQRPLPLDPGPGAGQAVRPG